MDVPNNLDWHIKALGGVGIYIFWNENDVVGKLAHHQLNQSMVKHVAGGKRMITLNDSLKTWKTFCNAQSQIATRMERLSYHFGNFYTDWIDSPDLKSRDIPITEEETTQMERDAITLTTWIEEELPKYENPHAALAWLYFEHCTD